MIHNIWCSIRVLFYYVLFCHVMIIYLTCDMLHAWCVTRDVMLCDACGHGVMQNAMHVLFSVIY